MSAAQQAAAADVPRPEQFDAVIVGAGMSGLYQLHRLRELGFRVRLFEAGSGVGGTWYWNRYPGARFDSESYSYGYSFSPELLEEWEWSEHFAGQPETLRYLEHVADRFDLRRDIRFGCRVTAATWREDPPGWDIELADGGRCAARFLITAIGPLSEPTWPRIEGIESFRGEAWHTARWPHEPVSFAGKRVAVIGTGASGVQTIQEVAKTAGHLTVFQRRANWCAPLHNGPIDPEAQRRIKASYPEIFERCRQTGSCFLHGADRRRTFEVSAEEREAFWEKLYAEPGFGIWQGNFRDILVDEAANAAISDFIRRKIRQRVKDPAVAEKLCPDDHGFGTRRVPLETGYYEVYNRPNVRLVDLRETPIERITPTGIRTTAEDFDFDLIVYATGFDAVTGSFDRIDVRGTGGLRLRDRWAEGPRTLLGVQTVGFPNLLMLMGPHTARGNMPRSIEHNVEWVTGLLRHMRDRGLTRVEARPEAEDAWFEHVDELARRLLAYNVDSWFTGINSNVEGKQVRRVMGYNGRATTYRARCDQSAAGGYTDFDLR